MKNIYQDEKIFLKQNKQTRLIGQQTIIEYEGTKDKITGDWIEIRDKHTTEFIYLKPMSEMMIADQDVLFYLSNVLKMFTDNITLIILDSFSLKQRRYQQQFADMSCPSLAQFLINNRLQNNFYIKMVFVDQKEGQFAEFLNISKAMFSEIAKLKEQIRNEGDGQIIDIFQEYCYSNLGEYLSN